MTIKNNVDERGPRGRRGHDATSAATVDVSSSAAAAAAPPTYEVHGVGMAFAKAESQRLAIASLFDGIVAATGGLIDPSAPPNVAKILNEQRKAQQKKRSEMGRLMLELANSSRPNAEHKSSKGGWTATVTAYVDGGKKVESVGVGKGKSDAEDIAYANISDSLADTMGVLRHSTLQKIVDNSPGGSVAGAGAGADPSATSMLADEVIDEETYAAMARLKATKGEYRRAYDEVKDLKTAVAPHVTAVQECRAELLREFQRWYDDGGHGQIGGVGASEEELDYGEQFVSMELQKIASEDPESVAFFAAKKTMRQAPRSVPLSLTRSRGR